MINQTLAAAIFFISIHAQAAKEEAPETATTKKWDVATISEGVIQFAPFGDQAAPPALKTNIHNLEYLGTIEPEPKMGPDTQQELIPYLVLQGYPCKTCPDLFVYIVRADGGSPTKMIYPGVIRDKDSSATVYEARAFFGQCLPGRGQVYVSFQKEKLRKWRYLQQSVFVAKADDRYLSEELHVRRRPNLDHTLRLVKQSKCIELKGRDRITDAKNRVLGRLHQDPTISPLQKADFESE